MTVLATLFLVALSGYLIYRYAPSRDERAFRLERFHPGTPMSDQTLSYYDHQRRYSDLAAIYGHSDVPDPDLPSVTKPTALAPRPPASALGPSSRKAGSPAPVQCGGSTRPGASAQVARRAEPANARRAEGTSKASSK
ncbi:hypothetical protein IU450_01720 [Nocardia abscessus]|uniref:hypothetical protein n=1 Tax=Nocardia abscessus TaxID=120957 RepID=UPI001893E154|nr:hypothetical protein [Nocardia abscessus]MBF6334597.1 hypothetical protein [Nocardia abscessus]